MDVGQTNPSQSLINPTSNTGPWGWTLPPPPQSKQTFRGRQIQDGVAPRKKSRVFGPERKLLPTRLASKKPMPLQVCVSVYEHILLLVVTSMVQEYWGIFLQDNERLLQVKRPLCYHTITSNDANIWPSSLGGKVIETHPISS
jgi:hypothetical protein